MMVTKLGVLGVLAVAVGLGGCSMQTGQEVGDASNPEQVGEQRNAVIAACPAGSYDTTKYSSCVDTTDASGYVHTRTYGCYPTASSENPSAYCFVESGYVLVGGGANLTNHDGGNGSLLTASYPLVQGKGGAWFAAAKDHYYTHFAQLYPYAIGLRLDTDDGLGHKVPYSADSLQGAVKVTPSTSANSAYPNAVVATPFQHIVISGGASTTYQAGGGQLLTISYPAGNGGGWQAASKQHIVTSPGTVTAYVVTIPQCPNGLSYCLTSLIDYNNSPTGYGYQSAATSVPSSYALTGIGAFSNSPNNGNFNLNAGRPIDTLYPFAQGAVAETKDHGINDSGYVSAYFVGLKRQ